MITSRAKEVEIEMLYRDYKEARAYCDGIYAAIKLIGGEEGVGSLKVPMELVEAWSEAGDKAHNLWKLYDYAWRTRHDS